MKTLMRQVLREWERAILWASVVGLSVVVVFLLSRLAGEKASGQVRVPPAHTPQPYLNEKTAFAFLQPAPAASTSARNPFAFSCQVPKPTTGAQSVEPAAQGSGAAGQTGPGSAIVDETKKVDTKVVPPPPPPPPKRSASILYRGLYSGGHDATRQLAFVSTRETPGEATGTAVLAPGQQAAGVTVKQITPTALVVAGPTGVEVSIAVGTQAQIALE